MEIIKKIIKSQFVLFCIVGVFSTIINYTLFFVLFNSSINYLISSGSGYIAGVLAGYTLNRKFTFNSQETKKVVEISKYFLVYTISLFLGLGFLELQVQLGIHPLVANLFTIGLTTITNFLGSKFFVFTKTSNGLDFYFFRYRYLIRYVFIGLTSVIIEILFIEIVYDIINSHLLPISITGFLIGVLASYILNSKLNFYVPKERNFRTFNMFLIISSGSYLLNILLINISASIMHVPYSFSRIVTAGIVFLLSYSLHRKFTFVDIKKIGPAIYLSETENVGQIASKLNYIPDFIHLDLVDKSFNSKAKEVDISKIHDVVKKFPKVEKMIHVMSKNPSEWIDKLEKYTDIIIFHTDINQNVDHLLDKYSDKKTGIAVFTHTDLNSIEKYLDKIEFILILGIDKPGVSGQFMNPKAPDQLNKIKKLIGSKNIKICFDGGVKLTNINKINCQYVVSGSTVLNAKNPKKALLNLKTGSRYYDKSDIELKKYLNKAIEKSIKKIKNLKSANIVGSFNNKRGTDGISDIDIVLVVDKLTKNKFDKIYQVFNALKEQIKTDFDHDLIINPTFGPLKFNKDKIVVFHLMIYDVMGHIDHVINSPFTCSDWETTKKYFINSLRDIMPTPALQFDNFFSSRRSLKDYANDLDKGVISYREYKFGKKIEQKKLFKQMDNKDKFEFNYHIMKFCMLNFLKLYKKENFKLEFDQIVEQYFLVFSRNKKIHKKFIYEIKNFKEKNKFPVYSQWYRKKLDRFLKDFELQFKSLESKCINVNLIRHCKTKLNKPNFFLGQSVDPEIILPDLSVTNQIKKEVEGTIIYSSPMVRAFQTAKLLSSNFVVSDKLLEINYGKIDGKNFAHLKKYHPELIQMWNQGIDAHFPGGENNQDVLDRVLKQLSQIKEKSTIITHNVVIRCILGKALGLEQHLWHMLKIDHFKIYKIKLSSKGVMYANLSKKEVEDLMSNIINYKRKLYL